MYWRNSLLTMDSFITETASFLVSMCARIRLMQSGVHPRKGVRVRPGSLERIHGGGRALPSGLRLVSIEAPGVYPRRALAGLDAQVDEPVEPSVFIALAEERGWHAGMPRAQGSLA